jgi:hypothetical protein
MARWLLAIAAAALLAACSGSGPREPYNVTALDTGAGVDLEWDYGNAESFIIQRSDGVNYNFADRAKVPGDRRYFRDDDVLIGQWYYYRVAAFLTEYGGRRNVLTDYSTEVSVLVE